MKKICMLLMAVLGIFLLHACNDDPVVEDVTPKTVRHVSLVYIMGQNSLEGSINSDIAEMRKGASDIPVDGRLLIFVDRSSVSSFLLEVKQNAVIDTLYRWDTNLNSTDYTVMQQVFRKVDELAPATSWSLTLWSHGSGWMLDTRRTSSAPKRSIGVDTAGDIYAMNISELATAIESWHHLDFIFFDACFMQAVEVDYELRNVADYILGSPAEIPGLGAPYDAILGDIFRNPVDVHGMMTHYHEAYPTDGVLLSICQTDKLEPFMEASKQMLRPLFDALQTEDGEPAIDVTLDGVQRYCSTNSTTRPPYYDIRSFLYNQLDRDGVGDDYYGNLLIWETYLNAAYPLQLSSSRWMTIYYGSTTYYESGSHYDRLIDADHYSGVSLYVPTYGETTMNELYLTTEWGKQMSF